MSLNYGYGTGSSSSQGGGGGGPGPAGAKGNTGPAGPTGSAGPVGPTGPAGSKGDTGSRGTTGPKGVEGPQGVAGSHGNDGAVGDAGPSGVKGATGPRGPRGPRGTMSAISADLDMGNNKIIKLKAPTVDTDAATKEYVDYDCQHRISQDGTIPMAADLRMSNNKVIELGTPTSNTDAANKKYVDDKVSAQTHGATADTTGFLKLDGTHAMTGNLNAGNNMIRGVAEPTGGGDATTKKYVDDKVAAVAHTDVGGLLKLDGTRTMTGVLNMGTNRIASLAAPGSGDDATTKVYVDGKVNLGYNNVNTLTDGKLAGKLSLDGSSRPTANINMNAKRIINVGAPVGATNAATKNYVDDNAGGDTSTFSYDWRGFQS